MSVYDKPSKAFIMAAGFGSRMRPLTDATPKPLLPLGGRPLLDYLIDDLVTVGVGHVVVNAHYMAEQIHAYASTRHDVRIDVSNEAEILETGGGLKAAAHYFDDHPFYVINGDAFLQGGAALLSDMARCWNSERMDILMALQPVAKMSLTQGSGDYDIDADMRARRSLDKTGTHMFTSVRINHPRILGCTPEGAFSYLRLMDRAQEARRLYACEMGAAQFHHISTPEDLRAVEKAVFNG